MHSTLSMVGKEFADIFLQQLKILTETIVY